MAIPVFTLVEILGAADGKPTVKAWTPAAYEQPGLATAHKILGVTMTASDYEQPVAVMKRGYLRAVAEQNGETWAVGDILWAKNNGTITKTRPTAPLPLVVVGTVFAEEATGGPFTVDVDVRVLPSLGELSGVLVETPEDLDVFIYDAATHLWEPRRATAADVANVPAGSIAATDLQAAVNELDGDIAGVASDLSDHIADTVAAHAASAIAFTPYGSIAATNVQAAIQELLDEGGVGGSASASVSPSGSVSPSASISRSASASVSPSASASGSAASASVSPSASKSASISPSASVSPSASLSVSASASVSPSASLSPSASPSSTPSGSVSPSASPSSGTLTAQQQWRFIMWSPPAGGSVYPVAEASASVTVRKVRCIHTGSGSASANVIKNYRGTPSDILSSDLTSANTWQNSAAAGGGVALSEGDEIDVELVGVAGYVEQIVVQIDYEEVV